MKKVYNIVCGLLVLILLVMGLISVFDKDATFSEFENRNLKTFPAITLSSLIDGSFTNALQEYYADTFPGRESLIENQGWINSFYCFEDPGVEEDH